VIPRIVLLCVTGRHAGQGPSPRSPPTPPRVVRVSPTRPTQSIGIRATRTWASCSRWTCIFGTGLHGVMVNRGAGPPIGCCRSTARYFRCRRREAVRIRSVGRLKLRASELAVRGRGRGKRGHLAITETRTRSATTRTGLPHPAGSMAPGCLLNRGPDFRRRMRLVHAFAGRAPRPAYPLETTREVSAGSCRYGAVRNGLSGPDDRMETTRFACGVSDRNKTFEPAARWGVEGGRSATGGGVPPRP